jgi:2-methylcitrate dehydratase PrpD
MTRQTARGGGLEGRLASLVASVDYGDVPPEVRETVRRAFVDTVGVTVAGTATAGAERLRRAVERDVGGPLDDAALPATTAALLYGQAGHALDYDDLSWGMDGHPSVVLVPPILALAAETDATGADATLAYALGFETACRIAEPVSPDHYEAGWHATATFGTFGATAAAASLLDLDAAATRRALAVAGSMPAGTKRNFGSMTKPLHAGLAAQSGVRAATLAAEGFTAGDDVVAGERGFWDLYAPGADVRSGSGAGAATAGGGTGEAGANDTGAGVDGPPAEWALARHGVHTKRYPCCYFTHAAVAATRTLVERHGLDPGAVERVAVVASGGAGDALAYADPTTSLEGKFSMQHAVAAALVADRVDADAFADDAVGTAPFAPLYDRVELRVDDSVPYDSHGATVTVAADGRRVTERRDRPPWTHDDPPGEAALRRKFEAAATPVVGDDAAAALLARFDEFAAASMVDLVERIPLPTGEAEAAA